MDAFVKIRPARRSARQLRALARANQQLAWLNHGEWEQILPRILSGELSQRKAAEMLGVGRATIGRLLARNGSQNSTLESLA